MFGAYPSEPTRTQDSPSCTASEIGSDIPLPFGDMMLDKTLSPSILGNIWCQAFFKILDTNQNQICPIIVLGRPRPLSLWKAVRYPYVLSSEHRDLMADRGCYAYECEHISPFEFRFT